jgi:hypothetical protein
MNTATAATMNDPDIDDAIDLYRRKVLPLKCVAWALMRYRNQADKPLTADELMAKSGASQSAAYRAIQELRSHLNSRISGIPAFPESGNNIPAYRENHSRSAGKKFPESGNLTIQETQENKQRAHPPAHARGMTPDQICDRVTEDTESIQAGEFAWTMARDFAEGVPDAYRPEWLLESAGIARVKGYTRKRALGFLRSALADWEAAGESDAEKLRREAREAAASPTLPIQPRASPALYPSKAEQRKAQIKADIEAFAKLHGGNRS